MLNRVLKFWPTSGNRQAGSLQVRVSWFFTNCPANTPFLLSSFRNSQNEKYPLPVWFGWCTHEQRPTPSQWTLRRLWRRVEQELHRPSPWQLHVLDWGAGSLARCPTVKKTLLEKETKNWQFSDLGMCAYTNHFSAELLFASIVTA